ncbi:zincin-like metallopeptidase domain-containing protein, partial [Brevundimonas sp.]
IVTDAIIRMLEAGTKPWQKGWKDGGFNLSVPVNASTGKPYRGINTLLLWGSSEERGYQSNQWLTFNQAKAMGAKVRKGEKSSTIVFYSQLERENEAGDEIKIPFLKSFSVFNLAQIDDLPDHLIVPVTVDLIDTKERIAKADAWAANIGADIRHGGNRAFYRSSDDFIQMPEFSAFHDSEGYYATLAHELTHWSGIESRLNREFGKKFGDAAYAFEELVAELSAAFTCAKLGISDEPRDDHASYLASWLKVLKADKRAIFTAASKAQQACDYLFEMAGDYEAEAKPVSVPVVILPVSSACLICHGLSVNQSSCRWLRPIKQMMMSPILRLHLALRSRIVSGLVWLDSRVALPVPQGL